MSKIKCVECDGLGEWEENHPRYRSPFCPEAYVLVTCDFCGGTGSVEDDREEQTNDKPTQQHSRQADLL